MNRDFIKSEINNNYEKEILFVLSHLKLVLDCVLYDPQNDLDIESINTDMILKIHGDWTGYEASTNEVGLNSNEFYPCSIPPMSSLLIKGLKKQYPNRTFCVITSIDNQRAYIRFHTVRNDEPLWCDLNVDNYDEPVFVEIG